MVVLLVSYPRSGNTLFRIVAQSVFGVSSTALAPASDELFFQIGLDHEIGCLSCVSVGQEDLATLNSVLVKTHSIDSPQLPIIYVVRDGRDCLVSFAHYGIPNKSFEIRLHQLVTGDILEKERSYTGCWNAHVLTYLSRASAIVRFEELVVDPVGVVGKALNHVGFLVEADGDVLSFDSLHERTPSFFRRGRIGSWKDEMSSELLKLFWQYNSVGMGALGYKE